MSRVGSVLSGRTILKLYPPFPHPYLFSYLSNIVSSLKPYSMYIKQFLFNHQGLFSSPTAKQRCFWDN